MTTEYPLPNITCAEGYTYLDYSRPSASCDAAVSVVTAIVANLTLVANRTTLVGLWGTASAFSLLSTFASAFVMVMAFSRKRPPFSWGKVVFDQQWRIVLLSLGYFITTAQALPFFLLIIYDFRIYTHKWLTIMQAIHEVFYWATTCLFVFHLIDTYERANMLNRADQRIAKRFGVFLCLILGLFTVARIVGPAIHMTYTVTVYMKIYALGIAVFCSLFTAITGYFGYQLHKMVRQQMLDTKAAEKSRQRLLLGIGGPPFSAVPAIVVVIMAAWDYYSYITEGLLYFFAMFGACNVYLLLVRFDDISLTRKKNRELAPKASTSRDTGTSDMSPAFKLKSTGAGTITASEDDDSKDEDQ